MAKAPQLEGVTNRSGAGTAAGRVSPEDQQVLRELAKEVAEIAALPIQAERARLWKALNQGQPERAMVLAQGASMPNPGLACEEPTCRGWEHELRSKLHRHENVRDDYPCTDYLDIPWKVSAGNFGVEEKVIYGEEGAGIGAYKVDPVIQTPADLQKLRAREITVDHESTEQRVGMAEEILGDILRVRRQGETTCRNMLSRRLIHLRGFDQFLMDMYDNPGLLHDLMTFLRDDTQREWELYEREGVLSCNTDPDHIRGTGGLTHTDELPDRDFDGHVRMRDMVCFGESQESVGVGPELFNEFVLQYQLPLMNCFGSVDYGCCEPQDGKFDLLFEHVPRLSSVSVLPWGDREQAAEKLAGKCVYAYKPHPGAVELPQPDYESAEKELRETLEIARDCAVSLTMKSSPAQAPLERVVKWTDMAQRVVAEAA